MNARERARRHGPGLLCLLSLSAWLAAGCEGDAGDAARTLPATPSTSARDVPAPLPGPEDATREAGEKQVFFGDLHVHSSSSIDAWAAGVRAGPEDAYRYARGEAIDHFSGAPIALAGPPLDFIAVADHAEYMGVTDAASDPSHPLRRQPLIRAWLGDDPNLQPLAWQKIRRAFHDRQGLPALLRDEVLVPAWQRVVERAERHDQPGRFTAFVAFEYSPNPAGQNLHRNVLFRGAHTPDRPFSALDSGNPEDLWAWMDSARETGDDLIAIPHNSNGSNGLMFARTDYAGGPLPRDLAAQRLRNEPIAEVVQIKGQSETHPVLSPDDPWADFELTPWRTGNPDLPSQPRGSYLRDALQTGMVLAQTLGVNPYRLGMIGSTDGHNASSPFEEAAYTGKLGSTDATPAVRLGIGIEDPSPTVLRWSAAGLAGIWAEANTRADLFDALRRREVFATSGPRIRVQLFGGWDFEPADAQAAIAQTGHARGVPMGGTLEVDPGQSAPTFLLAALKDPFEADLERIQIVKGWVEGDTVHERLYDVACGDGATPDPSTRRCPGRAPEPDLDTCLPDGRRGAAAFQSWWSDPEFDPGHRAFYYVRVLQVPTCRWSTFDANRLGVPRPGDVPATIQERALTSPIWLVPSGA